MRDRKDEDRQTSGWKDKKCVRFALSATIIQVVRSSFFDQFLLAISADRARIMEPCILFS